jgi:hypothetical protein
LTISATATFTDNSTATDTFVVGAFGPTDYVFNWDKLASVTFQSYGGTDAGFGSIGTQFALDNLTVNTVPLPSAVWLLASGFAGLIGYSRRKTV